MIQELYEVNKEIINNCFLQIVELKSDYYYEHTDRLSVLQKRFLIALTKSGNNIYSGDYIRTID